MKASLLRAVLAAEDRLKHHPRFRDALSHITARRDSEPDVKDPQAVARSICRLCAAARLADSPAVVAALEAKLRRRVEMLDAARLDWTEFVPDIENRHLAKAVLLKPWMGPQEKGVLFVSFEQQWAKLLRLPNLAEFARRYTLIVAPSWSPPHSLINCVFPAVYPGRVFCLISNAQDLEIFPRLSANYAMVPLYASSWVHPCLYEPRPAAERDIDILMVANFGKFKRHFAFFDALRRMPADLRVTLIGQDQGERGADSILAEARLYGVENRFTLLRDVHYAGVADAFCRAKISVVLSRREGSCVVVAESLFADTPVALLGDAEIGSRVFVNAQTGRLLRHRNLAAQLTDFLANARQYAPRAWAERHISCFESARLLNALLRSHAEEAGEAWTQDIATLTWSPDPMALIAPEDAPATRAAYDDLQTRFGLTFGQGEALRAMS